jgi:beta-lactamase regulating signal transducer with metallopeptidase domain
MELSTTVAVESVKALLLLTASVAIVLTLKGRPARIRAMILGTALIGTLLIPLASVIVPSVPVPVPVELSPAGDSLATAPAGNARTFELSGRLVDGSVRTTDVPGSTAVGRSVAIPDWDAILLGVWLIGAVAFLGRQTLSTWHTTRIIRRAQPVDRPETVDLLDDIRDETSCRRPVRLVASPEVSVPAVFGAIRPVVLLPAHYTTWLEDRLTAVLQHELTHIARFDWPVRMAARLACAVYWFNPIGWWAARRLDLEQELACDEEVLSLGTRPSSYACHLLGIARVAIHEPALAAAGLQMARRSDLEERIMRLLKRPNHRRVGLAVILPAVLLTAALVPAIASVQPESSERRASPALKSAMEDLQRVEEEMEPHIERIGDVEIDMAPILAEIEAWEAEIDFEALERIEAEMAPIVERMRDIEIDMAPFHAQMEEMHEHLETMTFHIDDGTLQEVQRQIHEQMEIHRAELEAVHLDLEPMHEQLERLHAELEPMHAEIAELTREQTAQIHEQMMANEEIMQLQREQLERIHEDLEPLHDEIEAMTARLEAALVDDVADVLRSHLGPVTSPGAPFREAAARIIDEGNLHVHDEVLELNASRIEVREILADLFSSERVGSQDAFDSALAEAVDEVTDLRILLD